MSCPYGCTPPVSINNTKNRVPSVADLAGGGDYFADTMPSANNASADEDNANPPPVGNKQKKIER